MKFSLLFTFLFYQMVSLSSLEAQFGSDHPNQEPLVLDFVLPLFISSDRPENRASSTVAHYKFRLTKTNEPKSHKKTPTPSSASDSQPNYTSITTTKEWLFIELETSLSRFPYNLAYFSKPKKGDYK